MTSLSSDIASAWEPIKENGNLVFVPEPQEQGSFTIHCYSKTRAVKIKSKQGIGNGKGPELFLGKSLLKIKKQIFDTGLLLLPYGVFPVLDSFLPPH